MRALYCWSITTIKEKLLTASCLYIAQSSASCPSNVNATVTISSQADATSLAACPEISSSILISSEFQGQLSLDGPTSIDGDVICESAGSIVSIESSSLYWINGELTLSNLTNLSSVVLPQLNSTGGINMSTLPVLNLFGVANVLDGGGSNISISSTSLTSVPDLNHYDRVSIYNNTQLRDITISSSQLGHLDVHSNGPALSLNLPNLKFTNHDLLIANCSSINMPLVTTIGLLGGGLAISGYKFLSLSLTSISEIRGSATIVDNEGMISISLPALSQIDDTLDISSNNELIALALPGLKNVTDIYVSDNNLLQAISFPSLTWFDNADMSGNFSR